MRYFRGLSLALPPMKRLLVMLVGLVIADGLITRFLVKAGIAKEGNPIMEPIVEGNAFIIVKILGALVCAYILWDIYKRWEKLALVSTSCLVVCYTAIVIWNLSVFFIAG